MREIISLVLFIVLVSCSKNPDNSGINSINCDTITIDRDVSDPRIISEILDSVEYIKLETSPENLIRDIKKVFFAGNRFFVQNGRINLLCFDRSGKFLFQVGGNGRGPGEYASCDHVVVNETSNRIWITDIQSRKIFTYDLQGKFLESKVYGFFSHAHFPLNREKHYFYMGTIANPAKSYDSHMIIRTDGDFVFEEAYLPIDSHLTQIHYSDNHPGYFYNGLVHIKPDFSNVIYKMEEDAISAKYFLDFGDEFITEAELKIADNDHAKGLIFRLSETGKVYTIDYLLESDTYLFFIYNKKGKAVTNFYSKNSKMLYSQFGFQDDMGSGIVYNFPLGLAGEKFIFVMPSHELYDMNIDQDIARPFVIGSNSLLELKKNGNVIDNPILMLASFKKL